MAELSRARYRVLSGAGRDRAPDRLCRVLRVDAAGRPWPVPARSRADMRRRRASGPAGLHCALCGAGRADGSGQPRGLDLDTPALEVGAAGRGGGPLRTAAYGQLWPVAAMVPCDFALCVDPISDEVVCSEPPCDELLFREVF